MKIYLEIKWQFKEPRCPIYMKSLQHPVSRKRKEKYQNKWVPINDLRIHTRVFSNVKNFVDIIIFTMY